MPSSACTMVVNAGLCADAGAQASLISPASGAGVADGISGRRPLFMTASAACRIHAAPSFFDETVNCIQLSQAMRIPSFVSGKGHVTCMPLRPGYGIARAHISQSTTPNEYTSACSDAADIARRAAAPLQSHTKMASTQRLH